MTDPCDLPATRLLELYASGELSPVQVTAAVLERAEAVQPVLNAFCRIDASAALREARAAEDAWRRKAPTGPLCGIPVSIKDVVPVKGWVLGRGSRLSDGNPPAAEDAPTVDRLRRAGAIVFAATTTCEGGWKAVTDSPRTGVTRNPHDPALTPGGSSGGAAAAVATGAGPLALGTDGGGSVRIPSSFSGLFGLKPSYGRLPQFPIGPHYGNMAHQGPMARTVADAALMLRTASGPHPMDSDTLPPFGAADFDGLDGPLEGCRVGVTPDFGFMPTDPTVRAAFAAVAPLLEALGAAVVEVPPFDDWRDPYRTLWSAGAFQALRRLLPDQLALVDPGYVRVAEAGSSITFPDYLDAAMFRTALRQKLGQLHGAMDFVVSPSVAVPPFEAGVEKPNGPFRDWLDWAGFSLACNLTGQPAASLPIGRDGNGLPVGIQIIGRPYDDVGVLRVSKALESGTGVGTSLPSTVTDRLRSRDLRGDASR